MGQATYVACEVLRDGKDVAMKFLATEELLKHILFGQESQVKVNITTAQVYCEEEKLTTDTKVEFKYRGWKYINDKRPILQDFMQRCRGEATAKCNLDYFRADKFQAQVPTTNKLCVFVEKEFQLRKEMKQKLQQS